MEYTMPYSMHSAISQEDLLPTTAIISPEDIGHWRNMGYDIEDAIDFLKKEHPAIKWERIYYMPVLDGSMCYWNQESLAFTKMPALLLGSGAQGMDTQKMYIDKAEELAASGAFSEIIQKQGLEHSPLGVTYVMQLAKQRPEIENLYQLFRLAYVDSSIENEFFQEDALQTLEDVKSDNDQALLTEALNTAYPDDYIIVYHATMEEDEDDQLASYSWTTDLRKALARIEYEECTLCCGQVQKENVIMCIGENNEEICVRPGSVEKLKATEVFLEDWLEDYMPYTYDMLFAITAHIIKVAYPRKDNHLTALHCARSTLLALTIGKALELKDSMLWKLGIAVALHHAKPTHVEQTDSAENDAVAYYKGLSYPRPFVQESQEKEQSKQVIQLLSSHGAENSGKMSETLKLLHHIFEDAIKLDDMRLKNRDFAEAEFHLPITEKMILIAKHCWETYSL